MSAQLVDPVIRGKYRWLWLVIAAVAISACSEGAKTVAPDKNSREFSPPKYTVRINTEVPSTYVRGSRKAEEMEAIEALVQRTPAGDRAAMRSILAKPNVDFVGSDDAESARLMEIIGSIRFAEGVAGRSAVEQGQPQSKKRVRVVVALVPSLERSQARATVLRRPNDDGRPVLLLRESDVTPHDLAAGLRAAAASFAIHGMSPTGEVKQDVRRSHAKGSPKARTVADARQLEMLRSARIRNIPGVGRVKAMDIMVDLNPRG